MGVWYIKNMNIKFIDLFCGIGGFRLGFENACKKENLYPNCVFSSEIKSSAIDVYKSNFGSNFVEGDITKIKAEDIPSFDVLLAGFPCQAFSSAGHRHGFSDTRGTLFFDIERILKFHRPKSFILENVEGLVKHDLVNKNDDIGYTLTTILDRLRVLGYKVSWKVLNSLEFGLAQSRKRIFIVGSKVDYIPLNDFEIKYKKLGEFLEKNIIDDEIGISKILFKKYKPEELYGKAIKDRRGGKDNIHSWDLELRGKVNKDQKLLLGELLKARRNKKWATLKGIVWTDGMPLTIEEIKTFCSIKNLKSNLDDLVKKGYLKYEHPKDLIENNKKKKIREFRPDLEKGYNLVTGKLSFEVSNILDPQKFTPTLVATDIDRLAIIDNNKLRKLTNVELKRLFGFPESFIVNTDIKKSYDLFGNSIAVPVVEEIGRRILQIIFLQKKSLIFYVPSKEVLQKNIEFT